MSRSGPDYGNNYGVFGVQGQADLDAMAYNRGVNRIDNKGRMLLYDDFSVGLSRWWKTTSGNGIEPYIDYGESKGYGRGVSALFDPVDGDGASGFYNVFGLPVSERVGFEVHVYFLSDAGRLSIQAGVNYTTGGSFVGRIYIDPYTNDVILQTNSGQVILAENVVQSNFVNRWNAVKLVLNAKSGMYERLMLNNQIYDLTEYDLSGGANGFAGSYYLDILAEGMPSSFVNPVNVGVVIITCDEP